MALQHLRSSTAHKRPIPTVMSAGQIAINTNEASPAVFFKDSNGDLVKVGPVHIGEDAPNSSPASVAATALVTGTVYQILTVGTSDFTSVGASANTVGTIFTATGTTTGTGTVSGQQGVEKGEMWLDTTGGTYVLKIYDGSAWRSESGTFVDSAGDTMTGALLLDNAASASAPDLSFDGDADTGVYSPGANQVAVATGGTGRLFIDASGLISAPVGTVTLGTAATTNGVINSADNVFINIDSDNSTTNRSFVIGKDRDTESGGTELFRIQEDGKVGIGTSSPANDIHILGTTGARIQNSVDTDSQFLLTYSSNSPDFRMYDTTGSVTVKLLASGDSYLNGGNVGIGNTSPANSSGYNTLTIGNGTSTGGQLLLENTSGNNFFIWHDSNGANIYNQSATSQIFYTNALERMRIDSSGRLGIGTTSPSNILSLDDTEAAGGVGIDITNQGDGGSSTTPYVFINAKLNPARPGGEIRFGRENTYGSEATADSFMAFYTAVNSTNTERMRIDSSGRVGIGATEPQATLHANGAILSSGALAALSASNIFFDQPTSALSRIGVVGANTSTTGTLSISQYSSDGSVGRDAFTIDSTGRVGIGTSPSYLLDARTASGNAQIHLRSGGDLAQLLLISNDTTGVSQINFGDNDANNVGLIAYDHSNNALKFTTNSSEAMRIASDGSVGIGTSSPSSKLDVDGDVRITSDLTIDVDSTAFGGIAFKNNNTGTSGYWRIAGDADGDLKYERRSSAGSFESAPFNVSSTGVASFANNVGIGTTTVDEKLHVSGGNIKQQLAAATNGGFNVNNGTSDLVAIGTGGFAANGGSATDGGVRATNNLVFATGSGTPERARIDSSGNVGIGTSSPDYLLDVEAASPALRLNSTASNNVNSIWFGHSDDANAGAIRYWGSAAGLGSFANSLTFETNGTQAVHIDSSQRVGIGTTSPTGALDVGAVSGAVTAGDLTVTTGSTTAKVTIGRLSSTSSDNTSFRIRDRVDRDVLTVDPSNFVYSQASGERVRIDSSGRLLVGTTTEGQANADNLTIADSGTCGITLRSASNNYGRIYFSDGTSGDAEYRGIIQYDHSNDRMQFAANASTALTIDSSGNVGIGNTVASTIDAVNNAGTLVVGDGANANGITIYTGTSNAGELAFADGTTGSSTQRGRIQYAHGDNSMRFFADASEAMRIDSAGRVGVGTSSLVSKFTIDNGGRADPSSTGSTTQSNSAFEINADSESNTRLMAGMSTGSKFWMQVQNPSDNGTSDILLNPIGGNVGIGTTNPTEMLTLNDGNILIIGNTADRIHFSGDGTKYLSNSGDPSTSILALRGRAGLIFNTGGDTTYNGGSERMRIQSDGLIRTLSATTSLEIRTQTNQGGTAIFQVANAVTSMTSGGALVFKIMGDGDAENANNSYTGISDVKLKENIVNASSQWNDIKALSVKNYNFKEETGFSTHRQIGLIAQEVEQISPGLVGESPDRDEEGNDLGTTTKSVNYSVLYMKAVKALQEAMERIETLEQRLSDAGIA